MPLSLPQEGPARLSDRVDSSLIDRGWTAHGAPVVSAPVTPISTDSTELARDRWYERLTLGQLTAAIAVSAAVLALIFFLTPVRSGTRGLVQMVETAGALERVALWQRFVIGWFGIDPAREVPGVPTGVLAYVARIAYLGMFGAQILAFLAVLRNPVRPFWHWLVGPLVAHTAMILMPPSNADVFFYAITGDLARSGVNPYIHRMSEFPDNPILPFNHWVDMTAVYGPLWTTVNAGIAALAGGDPAVAALLFKLVLGACALALALTTWWFVRHITGSDRWAGAAGVLVAWQPNLIVESTGLAHNDPVMMLVSTWGIMLAILGGRRAIRGGVILVTLSSLVKYSSLPLLGLLGLARLADRRRPRGAVAILGQWLLDGVAIAATVAGSFAPYWAGTKTLSEMLSEPGRLFSSPIVLYPKVGLEHLGLNGVASAFEDIAGPVIQFLVVAIVLGTVVWFGKRVWGTATLAGDAGFPAWTRDLLAAWAVIMTTLALLPVNGHPWYWTWPVVPVATYVCVTAATSESPSPALPRWLWVYLVATAVMTIAYHTRIVHP